MRVSLLAMIVPVALSLSSCTPFGNDAGSRPPSIRLNPHPVRAYRVVLTLDDAPGPFRLVEGVAEYTAKYRDEPGRTCGYMAGGVGAFIPLNWGEPFELKKVSDDTYEGVVHADGVLDEDYDGEGVCHWEMIEIRARLRANDNQADTRFVPFIRTTPEMIETSSTRYFWKGVYANPEFSQYTSFGQSDPARINRNREELFVIQMVVREIRS
ncbi:MAG: hypothetical protein QM795_02275 [Pseudoxanthomonas sp.]